MRHGVTHSVSYNTACFSPAAQRIVHWKHMPHVEAYDVAGSQNQTVDGTGNTFSCHYSILAAMQPIACAHTQQHLLRKTYEPNRNCNTVLRVQKVSSKGPLQKRNSSLSVFSRLLFSRTISRHVQPSLKSMEFTL